MIGNEVRRFLRRHPFIYRVTVFIYGLKFFCFVLFANKVFIVRLLPKPVMVIISNKNINFAKEIIDFFWIYCESIYARSYFGISIYDFSKPRKHTYSRLIDIPLMTSSIPEPLITIEQYLNILQIKEGETILDLGAYCGLSSIVFAKQCGSKGKVIAIEADPKNYEALKMNSYIANSSFNINILSLEAAVYSQSGTIPFISEGTLASSIMNVQDTWNRLENQIYQKTINLMDIVLRFQLEKVDIIKADIEGAEFEAFSNYKFFQYFRPRILLELPEDNNSDGNKAQRNIFELFGGYNYSWTQYEQVDSHLKLIYFAPKLAT